MWGAIIGDFAGSIYEYDQIKKVKKVEYEQIIPEGSFFSDDTILTVAIAEAMYGVDKKTIEKVKTKLPNEFINVIEKAYNHNKEVER